MDKIDDKFKEDMLSASVSIRNEAKVDSIVHIHDKESMYEYITSTKRPPEGVPKAIEDSLWCPEFGECIDDVLQAGAKKYAPRDWEKPEGYSMGHKAQCDALFHHLAREFVYRENEELIKNIRYSMDRAEPSLEGRDVMNSVEKLLTALKYDEMGTRHLQHTATRSVMAFTREKRMLD